MIEQSNLFAVQRCQVQLPLPHVFNDIETLGIEKGSRVPISDSIQSLFPKTCNQPIVHFKSKKEKKHSPLRVGVVLSGGQASGGHNVIAGLFDALKKIHTNCQLIGFLNGPSGILENKSKDLNKEYLAGFRNSGGFDMIGSGRTKIETPEQLEIALKVCSSLTLDGLVIIGGDDSNTNAAILAEYFLARGCSTHIVGVPKTIDGDLKNEYIATSFGFDTASKIYSEMIGNICRDALSAKKYTHFIKLMGRSASHIALECALQTHPNMTFIGEEIAAKNMTLMQITDSICDCITKRANQDKNYGVLLIPEGLIEFIPEIKLLIQELNSLLLQESDNIVSKLSKPAAKVFEYLPREVSEQLLFDRDPHGNVQVSQIATEQLLIHSVKNNLKKAKDFKGKFSPVAHFFGYEGRCGYPSNFDANYCYALGFTSAVLIANGLTGYMSCLQELTKKPEDWIAVGLPLTMMMDVEERRGKKKPVIKKALVKLEDEPFRVFASHRQEWSLNDCYRFPAPIQFFGPPEICNVPTMTLQIEQKVKLDDQVFFV